MKINKIQLGKNTAMTNCIPFNQFHVNYNKYNPEVNVITLNVILNIILNIILKLNSKHNIIFL